MRKTIEVFESKGLKKIKQDWHDKTWNHDFVEFMKEAQAFATLMTPDGYGADDSRWDTYRNNEFSEITAFYGMTYCYTRQVSILGLGPIWLGGNENDEEVNIRIIFGRRNVGISWCLKRLWGLRKK
jgi:acyl-CoA dehydrogenase